MPAPQVNGEVSGHVQSAFLQHLLSFPLVNDGVHTVTSNEYAQKSFKLGDSAFRTLAAPVLPYFAKPYGYVSPYFQKADSFGDKTLDRLEERFPIVKKPTGDIYNETRGLILIPYQKGLEGKEHVFNIYAAELKKLEQEGVVAQGKAVVSTAIVVSNETLAWLSTLVAVKKADASEATKEKIN
ncbi:perilipin mpl1 [Trichoderma cornu-damae]|uniref:Perilipin mpl1 n=1 Tax=Trichoderma cornu-damae TaxID=654480 RepID=A0A9P8U075_9HYPO|nr:perilipin mpl1 [Trichoderma cornu-damae]